jgi:hypothetical protein
VGSCRRDERACQVGEGEKDEGVQASGVLARPGRRLGALTACLARRGEVLGACVLASSVRLFA